MTYHGKKWSRKGLHCAALFIALGTKNADVGKIAVIVGIVQPVADDELVRNLKAADVGLEALVVAGRLVEEGDSRDGRGLSRRKQFLEIVHGKTRVDDVFDDHDVAAGDVVIQVLDQPHDARGLRACTVAPSRSDQTLMQNDGMDSLSALVCFLGI